MSEAEKQALLKAREAACPLYVRLRTAYYVEDGYCLDGPPVTKDSDASFIVRDRTGDKMVKMMRVSGCKGTNPDQVIFINLKPYPVPEKAYDALVELFMQYRPAKEGNVEARLFFGVAWLKLITEGIAMEAQDHRTKIDLLCNFFGTKRVFDAVDRGTLAMLAKPRAADIVDMVAEVLAG